MGKTGLMRELIDQLERNWESYCQLAESKEAQAHDAGLRATLQLLKESRADKDIKMALGIEMMLLHDELAKYANSPEEAGSIKAALEQLAEAQKSLAVIQEPQSYRAATATYSGKRMEAGLPLDSFREFLKSHVTRLSNRLAGPFSMLEKNILRQRKENLSMVKDAYITMQRNVLGL